VGVKLADGMGVVHNIKLKGDLVSLQQGGGGGAAHKSAGNRSCHVLCFAVPSLPTTGQVQGYPNPTKVIDTLGHHPVRLHVAAGHTQ
jgi:hypothetical protein